MGLRKHALEAVSEVFESLKKVYGTDTREANHPVCIETENRRKQLNKKWGTKPSGHDHHKTGWLLCMTGHLPRIYT